MSAADRRRAPGPDPDGLRRTREIERYRVLEDAPRRELQALVELAAHLCEVPMAAINLITDTEQRQAAAYGFDAEVCRRDDSMCAVTLRAEGPVILADASADERFRDNPFVCGEIAQVRFYAAHQLVTPSGVVIGTLCAFDVVPRELDVRQRELLASLAERVVELLELELRTRDLASTVSELREAQAELERSNEQLAAFAGQVSHDLRNPLTAMGMSLQLLRDEIVEQVGDDSDLLWLTDRAMSGTERMQALVGELLSFATLGGSLTTADVALSDLVDEVRADLAPALSGASFEVGDLPTVPGDRVQLRMLLQNLVANAVKFARPGESSHIELTGRRDGAWWRVEVIDHGIGIRPEERERVLEPFVRLDKRVAGSGIGLASCRRVAHAHGGSLGLGETPGGGTTAWVLLPVEPAAGPST
ncbi:sensor histidine kinase [Nocardioides pacificus]